MPARAKKAAAHDKSVNTSSHHHPNQHANNVGLAQPGRRIVKPKGSLHNLHANSSQITNGQHAESPSAVEQANDCAHPSPLLDYVDDVATAPTTNGHDTQQEMVMGMAQSHLCRGQAVSFSMLGSAHEMESSPSQPQLAERSGPYGHGTVPLRIDVNAVGISRQNRAKSKLEMATTILTACPLWDVITMLIIFIQLPPTIFSLVQGIFALITIIPTFASTSFAVPSIPSLSDVFFANSGIPSLHTVLVVDMIGLLGFMVLNRPLQNVALDLAQAVIAISLGGAATSKGGTTNSVISCSAVVAASHLLRWKSIQQRSLDLIWPGLVRLGLRGEGSGPPLLSKGSGVVDKDMWWPTNMFGVHVLAQGILRLVRRYLLWRQQQQADDPAIYKKIDPELSTGSPAVSPRSTMTTPDLRTEGGLNSSSDGRPPGPSPAVTSTPKLGTGSKRRKKPATEARVQQPFWAALANTKVNVYRDDEQSRADVDAKWARSIDASSMGCVDFKNLLERVWIMEVGSTEISFGVCLPLVHQSQNQNQNQHGKEEESESNGVEVRVNGAGWMSVKKRAAEMGEEEGEKVELLVGRIYGLTPLATYHCEFLRGSDHAVIYSTTLITQPAQPTEAGAQFMSGSNMVLTQTAAIASPPTPLQPSSPTTTLRNSIHAVELDSEKSKNNLRVVRKQHKSTIDRLAAQMEKEKSKLSNNGGTDERHRQRVKQLENYIVKLKSESQESEVSLTEARQVPAEAKVKHSEAKSQARDRQKRMDSQKSRQEKAKKEADRGVTSARSDIDTVLHKRSRFDSRQKEHNGKLSEAKRKMDGLAQAQTRRARERQDVDAGRRTQLQNVEGTNAEWELQMMDEKKAHQVIMHEMQQYQDWSTLQAQALPQGSAPATPEGTHILPAINTPGILGSLAGSSSLPGSRPSSLHVNSGFTPGFTFPASGSAQTNGFVGHHASRRRASSLEIEQFPSLYQGPSAFANASLAAAAAAAAAMSPNPAAQTSSAALLADSTALAPAPPAPFSGSGLGLLNGSSAFHSGPFPSSGGAGAALPVPVGAEKYSAQQRRRKSSSSGGSHGSISGFSGGATIATGGLAHVNGTAGAAASTGINGHGSGSPRGSFGIKLGVGAAASATPSPPAAAWERRLGFGSGGGGGGGGGRN